MYDQNKIVQTTVDFLVEWEKFSATPYADAAGIKTIGYGETDARIVALGKITESYAKALLTNRVKIKLAAIIDHVEISLTDNQLAACVSLAYNIGITGFLQSTALKRINANELDGVPAAFLMWVKAGGKTLQGLINRRNAEIELWNME